MKEKYGIWLIFAVVCLVVSTVLVIPYFSEKITENSSVQTEQVASTKTQNSILEHEQIKQYAKMAIIDKYGDSISSIDNLKISVMEYRHPHYDNAEQSCSTDGCHRNKCKGDPSTIAEDSGHKKLNCENCHSNLNSELPIGPVVIADVQEIGSEKKFNCYVSYDDEQNKKGIFKVTNVSQLYEQNKTQPNLDSGASTEVCAKCHKTHYVN